ncbi:universal stress protein [Aquimarina pacifica]|uniref:universal stress protein n=1 Tax=Aquimarina pacifica TaxID=1296415 RepID=UPI00046F2D39|nr:universal stress protein [Aquimarina pacifica]
MKRILLPTDFSDNAWNAIVYAMRIYQNDPCDFYILNVCNVSAVSLATTVSSQKIGHLYDQAKKKSKEGLVHVMKDIKNSNTPVNHQFSSVSIVGEAVDEIQKFAIEKQIELIIMGTQGATGSRTVFLGSTTHSLLKSIKNCPILVIPETFTFKDITDIGFATDFKKIYYSSEVKPIIDLAQNYKAVIRMVEVYKKPALNPAQEYNLHSLEHFFKNEKYEFHVIPDFANVARGILAFIEELEIDLIAMIYYEHSFIERLTREPVIKKMVFQTPIPLLIIPEDED